MVGLRGFVLSMTARGDSEGSVDVEECRIVTDLKELLRLEKDVVVVNNGALTTVCDCFPRYVVRFEFSPMWRYVLFVVFPKELVVFDLQYRNVLFSSSLPRGCGKFLDVLPDLNNELLYCAHLDGKLSTWQRKP